MSPSRRPSPGDGALNKIEAGPSRLSGILSLRSIRAKILLLALMATLVPAVSTAALSYVRARSALTETLEGELQSIGAQAARELDLWLKERQYDLRIFVGSFEVIENLERVSRGAGGDAIARLSDYLTVLQGRFPEYAGLVVVDAAGSTVAEGEDARTAMDVDPAWLDRLALGYPHIGEPYFHDELGSPAATLAVPIQDQGGAYLGGLVATLTFEALRDVLQQLEPADEGAIRLLGPDGRVIASSDGVGDFEVALTPETRGQLVAAQGSTVEYAAADGERTVATLTPVPAVEWSVLSHLPARQAYAQVTDLTRSTMLLVSLLLLVVGGAAWGVGLVITRPLGRLTTAAGAVAEGDLTVDLPVTGNDEVSYLTEVFNGMVARLRANAEELAAAAATLQAQNEELAHLSRTDALTGLHNRRHVMDVLNNEVSRAARHERTVGVLMLDVDKFKQYNDTYGHQAGDEVLKGMGEVLRDATRDTDIPARYGGEEFIVVLPDTDLEGAVDAGQRIRKRLAEEVFDGGKVTVSIGAAAFPIHGPEPTGIIAAADLALYAAKEAGRDRVQAAKTE